MLIDTAGEISEITKHTDKQVLSLKQLQVELIIQPSVSSVLQPECVISASRPVFLAVAEKKGRQTDLK